MRQALSRAGLVPERITYTNFSLFPLMLATRSWQRLRRGAARNPDVGDHRALGAGQRRADGRALTRGARPAAHQPAGRQLAARARPQASLIGRALIAVLELVEPLVEAALGQQLLVRAAIAQLAPVEDQDAVHVLDRRQPVGDHDGRPAGAGACRASRISSSVSVSTLDVASSRTRTAGSPASARANDSSCFCPTDSDAPRSPPACRAPRAAPRRTGRRGRRRRRARSARVSSGRAQADVGGDGAAEEDARPAAPGQQRPRSSARSSSRMSTPSSEDAARAGRRRSAAAG